MELLVNIDVPELQPAIDFYVAAFGLSVARRFGKAAVELVGANARIYLLSKRADTEPAPGVSGRAYSRHWTPVHLDLVVDALEPALARAIAAGATPEGEIHEYNWGRLAPCADPWGHGFCLLEFVGRGYDEIAG